MTKEELKQKAIDFVRKTKGREYCLVSEYTDEQIGRFYENEINLMIGFLTENSIQWHDLQKDPNDLPKDNHTVQDEYGERFYYFIGKFYYEDDDLYDCKPSKWCEIPIFKE